MRDELAPEAIIQIHADMSPAHALRHVARYEGADLRVAGDAPTPLDEQTLQAFVEQRETAARTLADERLALCTGVDAGCDVVLGNPAGELILASSDLDLLVLGSRRWGAVKRLALGSTSDRVIRHTACPVLVPPRGAESEHDERDAALDQVAVE